MQMGGLGAPLALTRELLREPPSPQGLSPIVEGGAGAGDAWLPLGRLHGPWLDVEVAAAV